MKAVEDIIRRPIITERSSALREHANQYVFAVDKRANKHEIKQAVSTLFDVKVLKVRTMIVAGKPKRFGRYMGHQNKWKRAIVTLAEGQEIDFFAASDEAFEE